MQFAWIIHEVQHVSSQTSHHQELSGLVDTDLDHSKSQDKQTCRTCLGLSHISVCIDTVCSPIEWSVFTLPKPSSSEHYVSFYQALQPSSRDPPSNS